MMGHRDVPLRRSLIVRLLATSVLVAVGAIAATAWLTAQTTTQAIEQQQGRSLADDAMIYDTLLGYAATHRGWDGVAAMTADLSRKTGHRVTLLSRSRNAIADSAPTGPSLRSSPAFTEVDPLRTKVTGTKGTPFGAIDARVVGPYRLPPAERRALDRAAKQQLECVSKDATARITHTPSGRPVLTMQTEMSDGCRIAEMTQPTPTEAKALHTLTGLVEDCLGPKASENFTISPLFEIQPLGSLRNGFTIEDIRACLETARQVQLAPYVAPPALLFVTDAERGPVKPSISLTRTNVLRVAAGTALVLAVAVAITVLVGLRLVRPLRRLTESARLPVEEQQRVPVGTHDEIGYLAIALNDLFDRRENLEAQRAAMVSDVAHELRTPLTNIRSWIEAAQDGMTPTDPQLLELLHDETVLLQHVVDDLRDLAAADAGTLRLYPEFRYVNDVLVQVLEAHRGIAETHSVELCTDFTTDLQMSIDPVRLRQLVGNLVSNAIRHTDAGGQVVVRTAIMDEDLAIDITDTGTGIDTDHLDKVFDRFWRPDTSRSRTTGGSGLGLAIVRQLAQAHDGDVAVTSTLGAGSTFTVRLPLSRQAPAVARS
jgi:two-component system sensor histidine kinase BaeS